MYFSVYNAVYTHMKVDKRSLAFEWTKGNIDKNKKHRVEDKEAEQVFFDEFKLTIKDERHSTIEERFLLLGRTKDGRKLSVIYTIRGEKIRIISARDMNKKERRKYEEELQDNTKV